MIFIPPRARHVRAIYLNGTFPMGFSASRYPARFLQNQPTTTTRHCYSVQVKPPTSTSNITTTVATVATTTTGTKQEKKKKRQMSGEDKCCNSPTTTNHTTAVTRSDMPRTPSFVSISSSAKKKKDDTVRETVLPEDKRMYQQLFEGNRNFVAEKLKEDPDYFKHLASIQKPEYMLIGCSDSRVPPDQLTNTQPGEIFIHRNVANLVVNTDLNMLAVLQYAVEVLKVKHVIVMGHYNCGGVRASMEKSHHGLIDKWLRNIKDVQRLHQDKLLEKKDFNDQFRLLVELNVKEQTLNLCKTSIIQRAWATGHNVHVHGWVYDIETGYIKDMKIEEKAWKEIKAIYELEFPDLLDNE